MKRFKYFQGLVLALMLANANQASAAGFSDIYVLGDSLSDQGNLFNATEELAGTGIPDAENYYMGRFSDEENYADELAALLGLTLSPSTYGGNNFAYGGARTDYNRVEDDTTKPFPVELLGQGGVLPAGERPWSLDAQGEAFADLNIFDPDALYIVFSGANDLADLTAIMGFIPFLVPETFPETFIDKVVGGIEAAIEKFVDAGAQDIIVPNLPNLGVVPSVTEFGPDFAGLATELTHKYNQALDEMLTKWENQANIIRLDSYSFITEVVQDPVKFGFLNASEACYTGFVAPPGPGEEVEVCSDPSTYVFWDKEHPTTAFHALMADLMLDAALGDILDDLIYRVGILDSHKRIKRLLSAKLNTAQRMLKDDNHKQNDRVAAWILKGFVSWVKALEGETIAADDAAMLIKRAELVLDLHAVE